mgnify:CR=1 FL=1
MNFNIPEQDKKKLSKKYPYLSGAEKVLHAKLPKWLRNIKYNELKSDDLVDWYVLLHQRQIAVFLFEGGSKVQKFSVDNDLNLLIEHNGPSLIITRDKFVDRASDEISLPSYKKENLGVCPLTMWDALVISGNMPDVKDLGEIPDDTSDELFHEVVDVEPDFNFLDSIYDESLLKVDLSKSKDELVDEFREYLSKVQKKGEERPLKGGRKKDLSKLINRLKRYHVLQYIDLWLWAKFENKTVAYFSIFHVIFNEKVGNDGHPNDVSDYTVPLALEVFRGDVMNNLRLLAVKEAALTKKV